MSYLFMFGAVFVMLVGYAINSYLLGFSGLFALLIFVILEWKEEGK